MEKALLTNNGKTEVSIPEVADFISIAIKLSSVLRTAKIEPQLRTKVLGAMITAMYWGEIDLSEGNEIYSINTLVDGAIRATDHFSENKKGQLIEALTLTHADFDRMSDKVGLIVALLNTLNIRSVLQTDTDFLGMLYEAFIRYGYDNNSLGIVFTPRHITRFCAELVDVQAGDKIIDLACGSGGFLVAAFDRMMKTSEQNNIPKNIIRESLYGFDTNPTVWALAALNMFFRGDGKSHIENTSCLTEESKNSVKGQFDKALLNPPFSQDEEPERDFISASLEALKPRGLLAVVVKSGVLADDENSLWRSELLRTHSLLGVISLPSDLFYPTAVDTSIAIFKAYVPQRANDNVFMAKVWNDGYDKLKGKRIEIEGSELPEILKCFKDFLNGTSFESEKAILIKGSSILAKGAEFCPEDYLPQPILDEEALSKYRINIEKSILITCTGIDGLAEEVIKDFPIIDDELPDLEYGIEKPISYFFEVKGGRSSGEKNYINGSCPYISSGDPNNSIIRLVDDLEDEVFYDGGITVTCFGTAHIQPWRFMARGNGGSAVRVLVPKFKMTYKELVWFATQINIQRWRFFYGRMSIGSRLKRLLVKSPKAPINDASIPISEKVALIQKKYLEILNQ